MNLRQNDRCLYLVGAHTRARTLSLTRPRTHTELHWSTDPFSENKKRKEKEKKSQPLIVSQSWLLVSFLFCCFFPPWPLVKVSLTAKEAVWKRKRSKKGREGIKEKRLQDSAAHIIIMTFPLTTTRGHCKQHDSRLGHHEVQRNTE